MDNSVANGFSHSTPFVDSQEGCEIICVAFARGNERSTEAISSGSITELPVSSFADFEMRGGNRFAGR